MANIRSYLVELETRLAPSLDAQSLQERLTEAENHLRDRAQEFEEIGLPPLEAEARAVAAFGEPEEYAVDVPAAAVRPSVSSDRGPDPVLRVVAATLALGLLGTAVTVVSEWFVLSTALSALILGGATLFGRAMRLRRVAALGFVASVALFAVLCARFVPSAIPYSVAKPRLSAEGGLAYRNLKEFDAGWSRVREAQAPPVASWDQLARAGMVTDGIVYRTEGQEYYAAPGLDPSSTVYGVYTDREEAVGMWNQNGRFMRSILLRNAMQGGYVDELDPNYTKRAAAFAPLAAAFFASFVAAASLIGALGAGLGTLLRRFRGAARRPAAPPPASSWERP